ncbi:MAG: hypothetical protein JWP01_185 [Myxococcales bacterium]|nr:hypothetical protein [Myxococcales bacterium]
MRTITPAVFRIALEHERQETVPVRRSVLREIVIAMIAQRIEPVIVPRDRRGTE